MWRIVTLLAALGVLSTLSVWAGMASLRGWGLAPPLNKPISIRQESARRGGAGPLFLYFGSTRRHRGGGYRGGK